MSKRERFRRRDPERIEPVRRMSGALRSSRRDTAKNKAQARRDNAPDSESASPWREVIDRTVRIGYEVADSQIRQGRKVAEGLSDGIYGTGDPASGDFRQVTETVLRSFGELTSGWLNLTTSMLNSAGASRSTGGTDRNGERPKANPRQRSTVALEIESKRPIVVTVQTSSSAGRRSLAAHPLRARESAKAPLTRVSFAPGRNGHDLSVRIRVPDDQPAGTYSGAIYDLETGSATGTLTVEIQG